MAMMEIRMMGSVIVRIRLSSMSTVNDGNDCVAAGARGRWSEIVGAMLSERLDPSARVPAAGRSWLMGSRHRGLAAISAT
jgi:hypothetical protein